MDLKLDDNKMIYSSKELIDMGFSYYMIQTMVNGGQLERLNKNHYQNLSFNNEYNDFIYTSAFIPKGVVCLISAASYYGLTSVRPVAVDIAIHRKSKVSTLPDWPKINIYYFNEERYELGIEKINNGHDVFHIYDPEKVVIDIIKYREKIGIEETKEIINNYLSKRRDLNKLMSYAGILGQDKILRTYLEVLV